MSRFEYIPWKSICPGSKIFHLVRVSRRHCRAEVIKKPPPKTIKGRKLKDFLIFQKGIQTGKNIEVTVLLIEEELEEVYDKETDDTEYVNF